MRAQQKQINFLLLFSLSIFLSLPHQALASDDQMGKGKMQIKTDRILNEADEETFETELDKVFPELFTDEIKSKITLQQAELENTTNDVRGKIFMEQLQASAVIDDIKAQVFTESYIAPKAYTQEDIEEGSSSSISSVVFYGSVVTFIGIIIGGIFILLRKWEM